MTRIAPALCLLLSLQCAAQDHFDAAVCMAQKDLARRQACYDELRAGDDSYKTWKPYLEYLALPPEYHTPKNERSYRDAYHAQQIVARLPAKRGGTVEGFFKQLPGKPVVDDAGWSTFPESEGVVLVQREVYIDGRRTLYRWRVSGGVATAVNGHASGITK